jgi:PD-(D/E)XK nuclease superfamily
MPIQQTLPLRTTSNDEFTHLDAIVMRCAYASQNRFGRYFDERVYENDLASRLRSEGIPVHTQVPVVLTHDGFEKIYYLDLIADHSSVQILLSSFFCPHSSVLIRLSSFVCPHSSVLIRLSSFVCPHSFVMPDMIDRNWATQGSRWAHSFLTEEWGQKN